MEFEIDREKEYLEKRKIKRIFVDEYKIYLKKSFLGWSVVYPAKTDGETNWKNLIAGGSWIKLGIIIFITLLILGSIFEYSTAVRIANECINSTKLFVPLN